MPASWLKPRSLLDELLNAESLYSPPAKTELQDDLRQQMLRIPFEDLEEQMETLRHFKKAHILRVAASEIRETLPLMKVSDYLTWIAEVVLDHVVDVAFANLVSRHGYPRRKDGSACDTDFAIIGYGKLGGIELGYTSDLDLVFIHAADPEQSTDGEKPIDNAVFYTRLGNGSCIFSIPRRLQGSCMKWICACAPLVIRGCSSAP